MADARLMVEPAASHVAPTALLEPAARSKDKRTGYQPLATFGVFFGLLCCSFVGAFIAMVFFTPLMTHATAVLNGGQFRISVREVVAGQIGLTVGAFAFLLITWPRLAKQSLTDLGLGAPGWKQIALALGAGLLMSVTVNGLGSLIELLSHSKHVQDPVAILASANSVSSRALLFFAMVGLAPLTEELIFRGFIFGALRKWFGPAIGILGSAIIFGAAHSDLFAFIPLVLGGLILAGVYQRTGNLWASAITHALFNSVSIAGVFFVH